MLKFLLKSGQSLSGRVDEWTRGWVGEWMSGWVDEVVSWWVDEVVSWRVDEWMRWWVDEVVSGRVDEWMSGWVDERFSCSVNEWAVHNFNDFTSGQMGEITGCRRRQMVVYSQTEMDLKSHRCIVNKQKVPPFFCVKVYWCHATHALHSSNNYFQTAILFDYNPTWTWGEGQSGLNGSAFRPSFIPNR